MTRSRQVTARRIDAAYAATILAANDCDLPAAPITDAAGYVAYLHPDQDAVHDWRLRITRTVGITLVALANVEGGWITLYDYAPTRRRA